MRVSAVLRRATGFTAGVADSVTNGLRDTGGVPAWIRSFARQPQLVLCVSILLTAMAISFALLAADLGRDLYTGSPRGLDVSLSASCVQLGGAIAVTCSLDVTELGRGRYRVAVQDFQGKELVIRADFAAPRPPANVLMLRHALDRRGRASVPAIDVAVSEVAEGADASSKTFTVESLKGRVTPRKVVPLAEYRTDGNLSIRISSSNDPRSESTKLIIDELGFFASPRGLTKDDRPWFAEIPDRSFYTQQLADGLQTAALLGLALLVFQPRRRAVAFGLLHVLGFSIAADLLYLRVFFAPEWGTDLRVAFMSGTLQEFAGANLNYGLHMASSILNGNGPLLGEHPPWHRMPGYGFFIALAGHADDLLRMALNAIFLQVALKAFAVGYFFLAAVRLMHPVAAVLIALAVVVLPSQIHYLQIESIIPAIVLINAGSALLYLANRDSEGHVPLRYHLLLHASFALWFALRPDVAPGWVVVSLILYWKPRRSLVYLVIPAAFYLLVGVSWALFKQPFTGEWSMTTNSVGASAMAGLWDVPSKFAWEPSDGDYLRWIQGITGGEVTTKAASSAAMKEVYRFWATYPGYVVSLLWHELITLVHEQGFPGRSLGWIKWKLWHLEIYSGLLAVVALSFALGHKRTQTFLLAWVFPLNATIFFLVYSSAGRFYNATLVALVVASLALLTDSGFYRAVLRRPMLSGAVIAGVLVVTLFGPAVDRFLLAWDAFRYGAPFLDPAASTLSVFEKG